MLIWDTYKECYCEYRGEYFYVVTTDREKKKVLTRKNL